MLDLGSSSGTLTPVDGGWDYVPDYGVLGEVTLNYSIGDGSETVHQTASFSVVETPPIIGTDQDDNLLGSSCDDRIDGGKGDDNIDAREGNDVVIGGDGDDHIIGGAGNDVIYAGSGDDVVFAGSGNDIVFGGTGNDRLFGEDGNDTLLGEQGDDLLVGGNGNDVLIGGSGNDTLQGDAGNDTLDGGDGDDSLDGGEDDDILVGGDGKDTLQGGTGNDTLDGGDCDDVLDGGAGNDVLADGNGQDTVDGGEGDDRVLAATDVADDRYAGGAGNDTLDYSKATADLTVDVDAGFAESEQTGKDQISGFENVVGGHGNDLLKSGHGSISLTGGDGDDTFEFEEPDQVSRSILVRTITDFKVGDRLLVAGYELHDSSGPGSGGNDDPFHNQYLSDENNNRSIRFQFERQDEDDVTRLTVTDGSPDNEYSIQLSGTSSARKSRPRLIARSRAPKDRIMTHDEAGKSDRNTGRRGRWQAAQRNRISSVASCGRRACIGDLSGCRLRRLGRLGQAGGRRRNHRIGEGRSESQGGSAPRWRHRQDAGGAAGGSRQGRTDSCDTRRRADQGGAA